MYYNLNYVRKVIKSYLSSGRAPQCLLDILHKTPQDLVFLFANSQRGWNFFKKCAGRRNFREVMECSPDLVNMEAVRDQFFGMFMDEFMTPDSALFLKKGELEYLTKFFQGIIIELAPV